MGVGLSNVTVTAAGQTNQPMATAITFPRSLPGIIRRYCLRAELPVQPATNYVTLSIADSNGVNFAAIGVASLCGRVVQGASGLPGVKVSADTNISFTGVGGYYTNLNLPEGTNVLVVVPSLAGYGFVPSAQSLVVLSNTNLPDFMAFPSLALAQATNGAVQLTFTPAFTCQVQASTDLSHWKAVFSTNNLSTNTLLLQFTDTDAANLTTRFYRLGQTFAGQPALTNWTATNHSCRSDCVAAPVLACQLDASTNLIYWATVFSSNLPARPLPVPGSTKQPIPLSAFIACPKRPASEKAEAKRPKFRQARQGQEAHEPLLSIRKCPDSARKCLNRSRLRDPPREYDGAPPECPRLDTSGAGETQQRQRRAEAAEMPQLWQVTRYLSTTRICSPCVVHGSYTRVSRVGTMQVRCILSARDAVF